MGFLDYIVFLLPEEDTDDVKEMGKISDQFLVDADSDWMDLTLDGLQYPNLSILQGYLRIPQD